MDPLSVAASVAGLLTAAKEVSSAIDKIVKGRKKGSKEMTEIKSTIVTLRSVLLQLQLLLLSRASIDRERASLILVDEVVVTLTACVMIFSDLDGCMKGLESDQQFGLLDSIRWAAKATELKGYLLNLEAQKASLTLIMNILTCQSTHNAEQDAGELKVLLVRVLETNEALAHRMSMMESSQEFLALGHQNQDSISDSSQDTLQAATASRASLNRQSTQFTLVEHAFEEDLQKSWVYQRSAGRDPRFSINSTAQLSLSWSMLSGLSLSNVSNIAVQWLPIFEKDLENSQIYKFGSSTSDEAKEETVTPRNHPETTVATAADMEWRPKLCSTCDDRDVSVGSKYCAVCHAMAFYAPKNERTNLQHEILNEVLPRRASRKAAGNSVGSSQRQVSLENRDQRQDLSHKALPDTSQCQDSNPTKKIDASPIRTWPAPPKQFELPSLPSSHVLQTNSRIPFKFRKHVKKSSISSPTFVASTYTHDTVDHTAPLHTSKLRVEDDSKSLVDRDADHDSQTVEQDGDMELADLPKYFTLSEPKIRAREEALEKEDFEYVGRVIESLLDEIGQPPLPIPNHGIDEEPGEPSHHDRSSSDSLSEEQKLEAAGDIPSEETKEEEAPDFTVLYIAASLFEFNIDETKVEAGFPYLTYVPGEIFDVISEKGELWLARNQESVPDTFGWIWHKHFAKISSDDAPLTG